MVTLKKEHQTSSPMATSLEQKLCQLEKQNNYLKVQVTQSNIVKKTMM